MKTPRAFEVEPAEDRARTRRRVVARGSDQPVEAKLVRTRAAVVLKTEPQPPVKRVATETEVIDISTPENTRPTRQVQHAKNLFALLDPDAEPPPPVATGDVARRMTPLEQSIARRDSHRTRRMVLSESDLVEVGPDGKVTGKIPLAVTHGSAAIEIEVEVPPHVVAEATHAGYRRGLFMGVAIATTISATLATVIALVV